MKEEEPGNVTAKDPPAKVPPLELKNLPNKYPGGKGVLNPLVSQATKTPMGTIGSRYESKSSNVVKSDLTKAEMTYVNVLKVEKPKKELEAQPKAMDHRSVEEFKEEMKKSLQKDSNTERDGLK